MSSKLYTRSAGVMIISSALYAQNVSFLPHRDITSAPGSCCSVVYGDFNGDGKLDLAVGSTTGIMLLLGDGAGGFKLGTPVLTSGADELIAADVNGDGKLDLLFGTGSTTVQTYLLLGRGDGTFQSIVEPVASGSPLFVADLNGDGKPDLGTWTPGPGFPCQAQVQLGNGDGTFQKPLSACIPAVDSMSDNAVVGDFNNDGIPDLAWSDARSNGTLEIVLGNGDGTFRFPSTQGFGSGSCEAAHRPLVVGDLNHDGNLDLITGGHTCIAVFLGKGDGTMHSGLVPPLDLLSAGGVSHSIFVADLNRDGNLDIAYDDIVLVGNGNATFQPTEYLLTASPGATSVAVADLNGDGLPDLVYINNDTSVDSVNRISVLLNNTPGPHTSVIGHSAATGVGPVAPSSIASAYGKDLARTTAAASGVTLPTQLGGTSLRVRDSTDTTRLAPLFYVSPTQINFLVPDQTAFGPVVLTVDDGSTPLVETANATAVTQLAPAFFTANGQGHGAAAATAVRVLADGTQQPVAVFSCSGSSGCTTVPIDLRSGQPVYLSLYGTGLRGVPYPAPPQCKVGGVNAVIQFIGVQPTIPGLDQVNILLPAMLASGVTSVECNVVANPVEIEIR